MCNIKILYYIHSLDLDILEFKNAIFYFDVLLINTNFKYNFTFPVKFL